MKAIGNVKTYTDSNSSIYCEVVEVVASTPYAGVLGAVLKYSPYAVLGEILLYDSAGDILEGRTTEVGFERYKDISLPEATAGQLAFIQYTR